MFGHREVDPKDWWQVDDRMLEPAVGDVTNDDLTGVEALFDMLDLEFDAFGLAHEIASANRERSCHASVRCTQIKETQKLRTNGIELSGVKVMTAAT